MTLEITGLSSKGKAFTSLQNKQGASNGPPWSDLGLGELKLWWSSCVRAGLGAPGCRAAVELIVANVCSMLVAFSELAQW